MKKSVSVIGKDGKAAVREDGVLLDGDIVHVPTMLADAQSKPGATYIKDTIALVTPETLASAQRILGDQFVAANFASLTDVLAQHTVVRKRLGDAANGRPSQFLDAAWGTLVGSQGGSAAASMPANMSMLTDAQKAIAADGVTRALASQAIKQAAPGVRDAYRARVADQHKSPTDRASAQTLDGASYQERMAIKSGARHSDVKAGDQQLSDADFYQRQRDYSAQRAAATE